MAYNTLPNARMDLLSLFISSRGNVRNFCRLIELLSSQDVTPPVHWWQKISLPTLNEQFFSFLLFFLFSFLIAYDLWFFFLVVCSLWVYLSLYFFITGFSIPCRTLSFSTTSLICFAHAISMQSAFAGSSLIFFHLPDITLWSFFRSFPVILKASPSEKDGICS